jgi:hypothetical protein
MALYHFSDDPDIAVFQPHFAKTSSVQDEPLVWAIDEWHSPMYFVPRQCPRACFWAGQKTTDQDREQWLNHLTPRFVMVVESDYLIRLYAVVLGDTTWQCARLPGRVRLIRTDKASIHW